MKMNVIEYNSNHEDLRQDLIDVVDKYDDGKIPHIEIMVVVAQFLGQLVGLQDYEAFDENEVRLHVNLNIQVGFDSVRNRPQ